MTTPMQATLTTGTANPNQHTSQVMVSNATDKLLSSTAPQINNAVSFADLDAVVTAYNALLAALRTRGIITGS